ncbi:MAG TPA: glycosyltransferase [Baekduia sp.]|uniref:glycosyltransferase n=1 Tax=Baekduia sp. TaxID=2600305 RepID=UPI002CDB40C9|nr:glycosyltransferase [Baekduia sp.]HMJ36454.1 glycosyltransferase [Baekduia sp.]
MGQRSLAQRPLWLLDDGGAVLGGGQLFALRLARSADRPVVLACPAGSPLARAAAAQGTPWVDVPFPAPHPAQAGALRAAARRLSAVVPADAAVVSGAIRASLVAGLSRIRGPVVHLLHERDSAARPTVRLALRRSRVLAVGAIGAQTYRAALPRARVIAVNNFLARDELAALAGVRRTRTGGVLGVLARLIPEKGIAELVDELAAAGGAWTELRVAGARQDEGYARHIEERAARAGLADRVTLLGAVDDVPAYLGAIDTLVVPSTGREGQPTVILEALATGAPVVVRRPMMSADFAGLPVFAYDDPPQLAAALAHRAGADVADLEARFGVGQVLAAIDEALV